MGKRNPEFQAPQESDTHGMSLDLFHAKFCDPEHDVIEEVDGTTIRFSRPLFYGSTDDKRIMLRAGDSQPGTLAYRLDIYDMQHGAHIPYEIFDSVEIDEDPRLGRYGAFLKTATYRSKARDSNGEPACLHLNSNYIEWAEGDKTSRVELLQFPEQTAISAQLGQVAAQKSLTLK